jgi:hypothetical protein
MYDIELEIRACSYYGTRTKTVGLYKMCDEDLVIDDAQINTVYIDEGNKLILTLVDGDKAHRAGASLFLVDSGEHHIFY